MNLPKRFQNLVSAMLIALIVCGLPMASFAQVVLPTFNPPSAVLSWKDNSSNETGFIVERALSTAPTVFVAIGTPTKDSQSFVDSTPEAGKTYIYRVCAYNSVGKSGYATAAPFLIEGGPNGDPSGATVRSGSLQVNAQPKPLPVPGTDSSGRRTRGVAASDKP